MPRPSPRPVVVALAALATVAALSSCSEENPTTDGADGPDGPTTLQPAAAGPAAGTTRVTCDVAADSGDVRLALDLPTDLTESPRDEVDCAWATSVAMHDSDIPYDIEVLVTVRSVDEGESLADVYAEQEPDAVEGDTPEGDDSILDLVLEEDVPAIGETLGDRLAWRCYCDGQDLITRMAQADGVRVTWSSVVPLTAETDAAFAQALAGSGTAVSGTG